MAKSEGRDVLILWLKAIHQDHRRAAPSVLCSIDQLIQVVSDYDIAVADRNRSGTVWSRKSILKCVSDFFDPPLSTLIPIGSLAWIKLSLEGTPLPLSTNLKSRANTVEIADNLKRAVQALEDDFHSSSEEWKIMVTQGESLNVVAEILDAIAATFPVEHLRWCTACFRRTFGDRKYCRQHKPGDNSDTQYRQSIKLRKSLPFEVQSAWECYQSQRNALGESFELICNPEDVPFSCTSQGVSTSSEVKSMVDKTLEFPWSIASNEWSELLADFQHVSSLLIVRPAEFNHWNEFSSYLLNVLDDFDEETTHPLWILNIICCADEWLKVEKEVVDGRTTDTAKVVLDLFKDGITDPKELAKRVQKSKQFIYRILNQNGLR